MGLAHVAAGAGRGPARARGLGPGPGSQARARGSGPIVRAFDVWSIYRTLWPVNKKFQWTGQGLKFLKKFRFGLEWPPAASGPQKSTMNRIFGRIFPSFIKFHCNRTIFEVFFGSGGRGALWSLNKKWGFYICVSYHQISYSLARV